MYILIIAVLAVVGALVHIGFSKQPKSASRIFGIFVQWALIFSGVLGLIGFYSHVFQGPATAKYIGWPANNPFQFEVGIANLSIGVLGLLCIWRRDEFWLATIIAISVFYWGAAWGHIVQLRQFHNMAPGNAGPVLYGDIIIPIILIGLYVAYQVAAARDVGQVQGQAQHPKKAA